MSNPVLLQVLSQGSNPLSVQQYYEKIFDSIDRVTHDPADLSSILTMVTMKGSDQEEIPFVEAVSATGNIEEWLGVIEKRMQVRVGLGTPAHHHRFSITMPLPPPATPPAHAPCCHVLVSANRRR